MTKSLNCHADRIPERLQVDLKRAVALAEYKGATSAARARWDQAYLRAVTHVTFQSGAPILPRSARAAGPATLLCLETWTPPCSSSTMPAAVPIGRASEGRKLV